MAKPDLLDIVDIREGWEAESEDEMDMDREPNSARVSLHSNETLG